MTARERAMTDQLSADLSALRISRDEPPPPSPWGRYVIGLVLLLGVSGAAYVIGVPYAQSKLFKTEVAVTEISRVSPAQATIDLTSTGYVVPQVVAKVGAKVIGRVAKVNIREGSRVKSGQILFELDASDQKSAVASSRARVAAAQAKAVSARARARTSRAQVHEVQIQWDREKKLVASGAVAPASAEDLGARVHSLEEQVNAADSDAAAADADSLAAQAEVNSVSVNLGNMTIPSPINGTAVNKPAQVGDVVGATSTLVELADFDSLLVETDVPEGRLALVKPGGPCEIVLDAFPDKRFRGTVFEMTPQLNRAKATATVKVKFVDPAEMVFPEMAARVSFLAKALDPAQLAEAPKNIVSSSAVVDRGGGKVVFVLDSGKVRMVAVTLGPSFGSGFELKNGPSSGTKVIKDPPATLEDGQPVKEKSEP